MHCCEELFQTEATILGHIRQLPDLPELLTITISITMIYHYQWISPELVSATFQRTPWPGSQESHREGLAAWSWSKFDTSMFQSQMFNNQTAHLNCVM